MRVSVIIPTYNSGSLVVEAIESVLAQTRPADEIIVVDDGSTDDTINKLERFAGSIRVIRKQNGGVSSARNAGVAEATGDVLAFLDADDVWHPKKLEIHLAVMQSCPDLGLLGTSIYLWPSPSHPKIEEGRPIVPTPILHDSLVIRNSLVTSSVVVRRGILKDAGEFDTEQSGTEDYDLWLRIACQTTVANLPLPLTGYRLSTPASLSKNAIRMEMGMHLILRKMEGRGVFRGRGILKRKAWAYFRYSCGLMYRDAGSLLLAANRFVRSYICWPFPLRVVQNEQRRRFPALVVTLRRLVTRS